MTSIRGVAIAVVMVALGSTNAHTADLNGGSVKDGYVPTPMISDGSSWYFRVDGAHARYDDPIMVEDHIYDLVDTSIGNQWSLGFGIGRSFANGFRADLTYDYRFENDVHGTLLNHAATLDGTREFGLKSHLILANLYYDFNKGGRFSPYIGAGLGWVRHDTTTGSVVDTCGCTGTIAGGSTGSVAAALMAGVTVNLTAGRDHMVASADGNGASFGGSSNRGLLFDVGYRFLYLGEAATGPVTGDFGGGLVAVSEDPVVEHIHAHELRFGLRYNFN